MTNRFTESLSDGGDVCGGGGGACLSTGSACAAGGAGGRGAAAPNCGASCSTRRASRSQAPSRRRSAPPPPTPSPMPTAASCSRRFPTVRISCARTCRGTCPRRSRLIQVNRDMPPVASIVLTRRADSDEPVPVLTAGVGPVDAPAGADG